MEIIDLLEKILTELKFANEMYKENTDEMASIVSALKTSFPTAGEK